MSRMEIAEPVICKVRLMDGTIVEIKDSKIINNIRLLNNFFSCDDGMVIEPTPVFTVDKFDPDHVRFVIENAANLEEVDERTGHFDGFYAIKEKYDFEELINIMEVANFLDCPGVMNCIACVACDKLKNLNPDQIMEQLDVEPNLKPEEMEDLSKTMGWFVQDED